MGNGTHSVPTYDKKKKKELDFQSVWKICDVVPETPRKSFYTDLVS